MTSLPPSGSTTRAEDRLPFREKLVIGLAGLASNLSGGLTPTLIPPIFAVGLGLSPGVVSTCMMIFTLWNSFTNPVMGWIADNTRTRWGRRRPYLFVGAILVALWFPVLWFVPRGSSDTFATGWLVVNGLILYSFIVVWSTAFNSIQLEMTPDTNERTSITAFTTFFGKVAGVIVGWSWFITQLPMFIDSATGKLDATAGARALGLIVAVLFLICGILPAIFLRERFYVVAARQKKTSLWQNLRQTLTNHHFRMLVASTVFFGFASNLSGGIGFYLKLYYVTAGDKVLASKLVGVESTLYLVLGLTSIPVFQWLCRRYGKTRSLAIAMVMVLLGMGTKWWTYTPAHPWLSIINGMMLAPAFTGLWQIIPSMNGDIVDDEELRSGERLEGAFASIYSWIIGVSFTLGGAISGWLVVWCGFKIASAQIQAPGVFLSMRLIYSLLPASLIGIALLSLSRYRLNQARIQEVRTELEARRGRV